MGTLGIHKLQPSLQSHDLISIPFYKNLDIYTKADDYCTELEWFPTLRNPVVTQK